MVKNSWAENCMKIWLQRLWRKSWLHVQNRFNHNFNNKRLNKGSHGMPSGKSAEALAEAFLLRQGVRILARNVSYRGGELDLIGYVQHTVLFIEVRLRTNSQFGGAAQSITSAKQKRIILAARQWLHSAGRQYTNKACRFDAVLLNDLTENKLEWIQGAFELPAP